MLTSSVSTKSPNDVEREKSGPSRFEVFLLFLPLVRMTIFLRGRTEYAMVDASALFDIAAMFLVGFYLLTVLHKIPWKKLFGSCMGWLFIYYFFCIFSFLWRIPGSSAPYIIYRAISMNVMTLYIFYIMSRFQAQRTAFDSLIKYIFVLLIFSFVGHVKVSGFHTNTYSFIAAVLVALAFTSIKIKEKNFFQVKWCLIAGLLGLILGSSGGSNVAFAMALCFIMCISKDHVNPLPVMFLPILGILIYEFFLPEVFQVLFPGKTTEGVMSATGRTKVWQVYLDAWQRHPWLGYGFCVGEKAGGAFGFHYVLSAHNGYISVLINTGIIGAFFFGMFLLSWFLGLLKQMTSENKIVFPVVAAFIVIMVNNLSVPTIGSQWSALSTVVLLVGAYFALFCQKEPKKRFIDREKNNI